MIFTGWKRKSGPLIQGDATMSGILDSDYEGSFKITNVNNFMKAVASGIVEVVKGTFDTINNGEPVVLQPERIRPVEEHAEAPADAPAETVTILKADWDSIVALAKLFREHPEAGTDYKISVGSQLVGTTLYVNEHIVK